METSSGHLELCHVTPPPELLFHPIRAALRLKSVCKLLPQSRRLLGRWWAGPQGQRAGEPRNQSISVRTPTHQDSPGPGLMPDLVLSSHWIIFQYSQSHTHTHMDRQHQLGKHCDVVTGSNFKRGVYTYRSLYLCNFFSSWCVDTLFCPTVSLISYFIVQIVSETPLDVSESFNNDSWLIHWF